MQVRFDEEACSLQKTPDVSASYVFLLFTPILFLCQYLLQGKYRSLGEQASFFLSPSPFSPHHHRQKPSAPAIILGKLHMKSPIKGEIFSRE
jgi:hypothetical protein